MSDDESTRPEPTMIMLQHGPEGDTASEGLLATPVGPNRWRLEESAMLTPRARVGNVVEVEPLPSGHLRLVRVVRRSPYRTYMWLLSRRVAESAEFAALEARVVEAGGIVSVAMGGVVMIDLPKGSDLDVRAEIDALDSGEETSRPSISRAADPWYRRMWRRLAG